MKKIFLFLVAMSGLWLTATSQNIGIGTPNPLNKLHVAGGFRLDTLANGIDSGVLRHDNNGVVYSLKFTGNAADVLRGDGIFGPGSSGSGAAWLLSGNSGINPATQFIGTTDVQPLLFRVNNLPAGLIHPTNFNTAFGLNTLYSNTIGPYNTANGSNALYFNTTGYGNTANGSYALYHNTIGRNNTAIGYRALESNIESQYNTAVGVGAGGLYRNGWNNTFIGAVAGTNSQDYYNCIALGNETTCTAPNQMRVGNTSTSSIGGQVGWTTLSDERMKINVQENVKGLDFIRMLRPVTYNLDANKLSGWLKEDRHGNEKNKTSDPTADDLMRKSRIEKSKIVFSGFLAQDVEKAARQMGYDFSGVDAPKNENDLYGLRYADFVVPLVKAVQEQQTIIEKQQKQIDDLLKELQLIKEKIK